MSEVAGPMAVVGEFATLPEVMAAAAEQIGEVEAYFEVATGRRLTFGQWLAAADGLARVLSQRGVGRGDVVAIAVSPSIDYAVTWAAAVRLGAIVTGINTRLGPSEIHGIFGLAAPVLTVADDGLALPDGVAVVRRSELAAIGDGDQLPLPDVAESDPVAIIWTSGTTGLPKGAWFDHANQRGALLTAGAMTHPFDRRLTGVPMAHAGYMAKLWEQWAMGVANVITPQPWSAQVMLDVLVQERITVGAGVPTQWAKLLELDGLDTADFSHLRIGLAATAPASPELVERVRATLGCPVVVRYAMTESPSITGTDPTDPPEVQYRTVGRPVGGTEIRLRDEDGRPPPPGEVGRVQVKGPCTMRGYWGDPARTAEVLSADGWVTSSDLGRIDADGNLVLVGRIGDMYIRGGYNVYPLEVENVLAEHPGVDRVAVVGVPAPVIGEIGVAFAVAASPSGPPTLEELRAWVRDRLADYKAPDRLVLVDDLPLTAMAKVDKQALARLASEA